MKQLLTVIIPCYNESENLNRGVLNEVSTYLDKHHPSYEVIISDDASTDNSRELTQTFIKTHPKFQLLTNPHGGKSFALKHGLEQAKGEHVLFTDMDQSTPISELKKLLLASEDGYQIVIGSRGHGRKNFPLYRKFASGAFRVFRKSLLLHDIEDTQCGFKLADTHAAKHLFASMTIFHQTDSAKGWTVTAWDVEFLFLAEKFGYRIKEVRVEWSDKDETTTKNRGGGKFLKESFDMLKQVTRVKLNNITGKYESKSQ